MKNLVLAAFLGAFSVSAFGASCDSPVLQAVISGINQNVPQRVDSVTTISQATCQNGSLMYVYELNDGDGIEFSKFGESQKKMFIDIQKALLNNLYCTTLKELHQHTNSIIWTYKIGSTKFAEFELKPTDCK